MYTYENYLGERDSITMEKAAELYAGICSAVDPENEDDEEVNSEVKANAEVKAHAEAAVEEEPKPVKRRPGRPRKNPVQE